MWRPDTDVKGTVFLSFFHFHVLSVPFCDYFVFLCGPLYMLNTYHIIPTFMFVILSTSVDLSHWTVCSRLVLSVLGFVCLCVCACVCVCDFLFLFFKIFLVHWTPVLLAEILPIFMLLLHSFGSDIHWVFPCRVHRNEGWLDPSHCPWMQF